MASKNRYELPVISNVFSSNVLVASGLSSYSVREFIVQCFISSNAGDGYLSYIRNGAYQDRTGDLFNAMSLPENPLSVRFSGYPISSELLVTGFPTFKI